MTAGLADVTIELRDACAAAEELEDQETELLADTDHPEEEAEQPGQQGAPPGREHLLLTDLFDRLQGKGLAPRLPRSLLYHAFFLYHQTDRDWVFSLMDRLEDGSLGFRCCSLERDLDRSALQSPQTIHYAIRASLKTVVVLSPEFLSTTWYNSDASLLTELDVLLLHKDLVLLALHDCDVPPVLYDIPLVDVDSADWWSQLLGRLCATDDVSASVTSLPSPATELRSGQLLVSEKSRCSWCGQELVCCASVPAELKQFGIHVSDADYTEAIGHVMLGAKFRCHVVCYNMPLLCLLFTGLLVLCLTLVPLLEERVLHTTHNTGLEYVHGSVLWLCILMLYMLTSHLSRRKMKQGCYQRLSHANAILIKHNLLAGVENLGLADCNKFYLHLFYYEIGPCLAYLQELIMSGDVTQLCCTNTQQGKPNDLEDDLEACQQNLDDLGDDTDTCSQTSRMMHRALGPAQTNTSMQVRAEELLLRHSGEYISHYIRKRLTRPYRSRHVKNAPCLCQYVEQRARRKLTPQPA